MVTTPSSSVVIEFRLPTPQSAHRRSRTAGEAMTIPDLIEFLDFNRQKTLGLLDTLAKEPDAARALGWRPGPGRAHVAWQLMHIAATDDRHVHVRMTGGQPHNAEYVRRFAGGSTPDDDIPSLDEVRRYLDSQRQDLLAHLRGLDAGMLDKKPNE